MPKNIIGIPRPGVGGLPPPSSLPVPISNDNENIFTDDMKKELIKNLKILIEQNSDKNVSILEIVNSIKENQDGSS